MIEVDLVEAGGYVMKPGEFVLASTREVFHLPDDVACEFKLKSSLARAGLQHALASFGDPGFNKSVLTLELSNSLRAHWLRLTPGQLIGQILFYRVEMVPTHASYALRGKYNGDLKTAASKGLS
jgi:dCTP deaminase